MRRLSAEKRLFQNLDRKSGGRLEIYWPKPQDLNPGALTPN